MIKLKVLRYDGEHNNEKDINNILEENNIKDIIDNMKEEQKINKAVRDLIEGSKSEYEEEKKYDLQAVLVLLKYFDPKARRILNQIQKETNDYSFWLDNKHSISHTLLAYCGEKEFKDRYDGLFWDNEGNGFKYKSDKKVVRLIDNFFIHIRKTYYKDIVYRVNISY
jgi:hypothetical protein